MALLSKLRGCCCIRPRKEPSSEKHFVDDTDHRDICEDDPSVGLADEVVSRIFAAENDDDIQSIFWTYNWPDRVAKSLLAALENAIKFGKEMSPAMKDAYDKAVAAINNVEEWTKRHPEMEEAVIITLIALGVLALLMPWVLGYLGFAEEGIIAASWAADWQTEYCGFVPKGSLFSYLQSLGTKIGRNAWI
ncbi:hypothetical protein AJ79_04657 [Helicocarpus griseus UAMH5409]|uniref:Uncharacterized protein n=1 Tax=Helicocarpus griseus UAMH5409 TaxID=1447875 RepID=A0A2B7XS96_9EURO|nr:hypothetical protein AJ79_04657 [Helicocarpus griseus UAMH5409]